MAFFEKLEFVSDHLKKEEFKKKLFLLFSIFIIFMAILDIGQDFLHAGLNQYQGYFSESLLYKNFWILFIPSFYFLDKSISQLLKRGKTIKFWVLGTLVLALFVLIHIVLVSLLIVLGSYLFFDDSFEFYTPFKYFISEFSLLTTFIYLIGGGGLVFFELLEVGVTQPKETKHLVIPLELLTVSLQNKQYPIPVKDILFIQSDRPYISIHTQQGSYLYDSTLKGILEKLQNPRFLRIHKSTVLNLDQVSFYSSRSNGDYDITLKNGQIIRLSRNYFSDFKDLMD